MFVGGATTTSGGGSNGGGSFYGNEAVASYRGGIWRWRHMQRMTMVEGGSVGSTWDGPYDIPNKRQEFSYP